MTGPVARLDVGPSEVAAAPMTPIMYRVVARVDETTDTTSLELEPIDRPIEHPRPGQFNMLWAFGVGEAPISLARLSGDRLTHTIRRVGAVTEALCNAEVGDVLGVRGPFGNGWPTSSAKGLDVLVVAGGLGVAPVRPLIEEFMANAEDYGQIAVLLGARSPDGVLYRPELDRWRAIPKLHLEVTVDTAPPSWRGNVGLVTQLMDAAPIDARRTTLFTCGPEIMMRFAALGFLRLGGSGVRTYVSLERNMHCAIGHCGHCQLGPALLCRDGPVMDWATAAPLLAVPER